MRNNGLIHSIIGQTIICSMKYMLQCNSLSKRAYIETQYIVQFLVYTLPKRLIKVFHFLATSGTKLRSHIKLITDEIVGYLDMILTMMNISF